MTDARVCVHEIIIYDITVQPKPVNDDRGGCSGLAYLPNRYVNPLHTELCDVAGWPAVMPGTAIRKKKLFPKPSLLVIIYYRYYFFFSLGGDFRVVPVITRYRIIIIVHNNIIYCTRLSSECIGATINDRDFRRKQKKNIIWLLCILWEECRCDYRARIHTAGGKHRGRRLYIINNNTYVRLKAPSRFF